MPTDTDSIEDKRSFDRFSAKFPAKYSYIFKGYSEEFGSRVHMCDASAEGVGLVSKEAKHPEELVAFEVKLPDGKSPMKLNGNVKWCQRRQDKSWDLGLKFCEISFMQMSRLYTAATENP